MVDYHYPVWRRIAFVVILVLALSLVVVPPLAKGTVNVRVYSFSTPDTFVHIYLKLSQFELHTVGFPHDSGWIVLKDNLPRLDIASRNSQLNPNSVLSSQIQSGRYDAIRLSISEATIFIGSLNNTVCTQCGPVEANATISIPPGGFGDILMVLGLDYSHLLTEPSAFSVKVLEVSSR